MKIYYIITTSGYNLMGWDLFGRERKNCLSSLLAFRMNSLRSLIFHPLFFLKLFANTDVSNFFARALHSS